MTGLGHDLGLARVFLCIQNIGRNTTDAHHTGQELGGFHIRGTHQHRASGIGEFHHLVDDGVELAFLGLVDDVVLVVTDDGTVGGDDHHIQLVDVPELPCLRFCRTGHAGQLVVHTEVVLQGNRGKGLRGGFHLHVFLGLHGLVKTVTPAAAFHDTAGALVHNLYLIVHNHVVHVLGEHGVGFQELDDRVHAFALKGEVLHEGILFLCLFRGAQRGVAGDFRDGGTHVREHEEVGIGHAAGQGIVTLIRHIHGVKHLIDNEVQRIGNGGHLPLVVLHIIGLRLLHELLHTGFAEELDKRLILGKALVAAVQQQSAVFLVPLRDELFGLVQGLGHQRALLVVEVFHVGTILHELLVSGSFFHGTGNDQGRTGIVNEHGVYLVHDGVMVLALHQVRHARAHIVTEVVKAELVIGTEGDVAVIGGLAGGGVGLMLVNAVHGQAMEHVQRAHPLGVTLGQVVVHGNHMHAFAGQGIQEHRKRSNQGFTFTGGHFRNHAALFLVGFYATVKDDTADELDIVMHHVPGNLIAAGHPVVVPDGFIALNLHEVAALGGQEFVELACRHFHAFVLRQTAGGALHNGEGLRQELVQDVLDGGILVLDEFVALRCQRLLFFHGDVFLHLQFNFCDTVLEGLFHRSDLVLQRLAVGTELIIGKLVNLRVDGKNLIQYGTDCFHVPVTLAAEDFLKNICYCHFVM